MVRERLKGGRVTHGGVSVKASVEDDHPADWKARRVEFPQMA